MKKYYWLFPLVVILLGGCAREIGDSCSSNAECGYQWVCDRSQPGGYCTITPCNDEICPGGSRCVAFGTQSSWCMKNCRHPDDCRGGYVCVFGFDEHGGGFCNQSDIPQEPQIEDDSAQGDVGVDE